MESAARLDNNYQLSLMVIIAPGAQEVQVWNQLHD